MGDNGLTCRCVVCREKIGFKEEINVNGMVPVCSEECAEVEQS